MEEPLEKAWARQAVGENKVSGNHQRRVNSMIQVSGEHRFGVHLYLASWVGELNKGIAPASTSNLPIPTLPATGLKYVHLLPPRTSLALFKLLPLHRCLEEVFVSKWSLCVCTMSAAPPSLAALFLGQSPCWFSQPEIMATSPLALVLWVGVAGVGAGPGSSEGTSAVEAPLLFLSRHSVMGTPQPPSPCPLPVSMWCFLTASVRELPFS